MAEPQATSQLHEGHHVLHVGPHPALPPAPYGVREGAEAAGDLRPRQSRRLMKPLQALREVVEGVVGDSSVMDPLSRQRVGPSTRSSMLLSTKRPRPSFRARSASPQARATRRPAALFILSAEVRYCASLGDASCPATPVAPCHGRRTVLQSRDLLCSVGAPDKGPPAFYGSSTGVIRSAHVAKRGSRQRRRVPEPIQRRRRSPLRPSLPPLACLSPVGGHPPSALPVNTLSGLVSRCSCSRLSAYMRRG